MGSFAIVRGRVEPIVGEPIERGTVLVDGGRIVAVGGPDLEIPAGYRVVPADGGYVLPGLVDVHTHLGVAEEAEGWADPLPHAPGGAGRARGPRPHHRAGVDHDQPGPHRRHRRPGRLAGTRKDADLCIWTGDPLDPMSRVDRAFIDGRQVYEYDRETRRGVFSS